MTTTEAQAPAVGLSAYAAGEIRAHLGRHTISKSELGRRLGVDDTWVGKRLNGQTDIFLTDLERIASVLNVPASRFLPRGGATEGYAPTDPRVDPLAVRVVATMGQTNRRPVSPRTVGRFRKAVRTGRPAGPAGTSRPATPALAG